MPFSFFKTQVPSPTVPPPLAGLEREIKASSANDARDPTQVSTLDKPEELRQHSFFRRAVSALFQNISISEFEVLFSLRRTKNEDIPFLLPILGLNLEGSFSSSLARNATLNSLFATSDNPDSFQVGLQQLAGRCVQDVRRSLEPQIFMLGGGSNPKLENPMLRELLTDLQLPQTVCRSLEIGNFEALETWIVEKVIEKLEIGENLDEDSIQVAITDTLKKLQNPSTSSRFASTVLEGLHKDIEEYVKAMLPGDWESSDKEEVWGSLHNGKVSDAAKAKIKEDVRKRTKPLVETLQHFLEKTTCELTQQLPSLIQDIIEPMNPLVDQKNCWLEVARQADGSYNVLLYAGKQSMQLHQSKTEDKAGGVIQFSNISAEQLNEEFFYHLLSIQNFPRMNLSENTSISDLYESLKTEFRQEGSVIPCTEARKMESYPDQSPRTLLKQMLSVRQGREPFHLEQDEKEMQKQALNGLWQKAQTEGPEKYIKPLSRASEELSLRSIHDLKHGQCNKDDALVIAATTQEINECLARCTPKVVDAHPESLIPFELRQRICQFIQILGLDSSSIGIIKKSIGKVLGKKTESQVADILQEIIPDLEDIKAKKKTSIEKGILQRIRDEFNELRGLRLSPLHALKLMRKTIIGSFKLISLGISVRILSRVLLYIPACMGLSVGATQLLSLFFLLLGTKTFKKCIPAPILRQISKLRSVAEKKQDALMQNVKAKGLSSLMNLIFSSEAKKTKAGSEIHSVHETILQSHGLDFKVQRSHEGQTIDGDVLKGRIPLSSDFLGSSTISQELSEWRRDDCLLTPANALTHLESCLRIVSHLETHKSSELEKEVNLRIAKEIHSYIRKLPIPIKNPQFWNEIEDKSTFIDKLHDLQEKLLVNPSDSEDLHENTECFTSQYTILVCNLYLTQSLDPLLAGASICGKDFMEAVSPPMSFIIGSPETRQQIRDLYFFFKNNDKPALFDYKNIVKKFPRDIFDPLPWSHIDNKISLSDIRLPWPHIDDEISLLNIRLLEGSREHEYYVNLWKTDDVKQKLVANGIAIDHLSDSDALHLLFRNPGQILPKHFSKLRSTFLRTRVLIYNSRYSHDKVLLSAAIAHQDKLNISSAEEFPSLKLSPTSGPVLLRTGYHKAKEMVFSFSTTHPLLEMYDKSRDILSRSNSYYESVSLFNYFTSAQKQISSYWQSSILDSKTPRPLRKIYPAQVDPSEQALPRELRESLSEKQIQELELLRRDQSMQVMRTLSYYKKTPKILEQEIFLSLLETLITESFALEYFSKANPENIRVLGEFFTEMLEQFGSDENIKTQLHLLRISRNIQNLCHGGHRHYDSFPNSQLIREKVNAFVAAPESAFRSKHLSWVIQQLGYLHVSKSGNIAGKGFTEDDRDVLQVLVAETMINSETCSVPHQKMVFHLCQEWGPRIKTLLENPALRQTVLSSICKEQGIPIEGEWTGQYPSFKCGDFDLNLHVSYNKTQKAEKSNLRLAVAKQMTLFFSGNTEYYSEAAQIIDDHTIYFPELKVYVKDLNGDRNFQLIKEWNGKQFTLLSAKPEEAMKHYWIETPPADPKAPQLLEMDKEELVERYLLDRSSSGELSFAGKIKTFEGKDHLEIDLSKSEHHLDAIREFSPIGEITGWVELENQDKLKFFEVLGQRFRVDKKNAFIESHGKTFKVAENQVHPIRKKHAQSILLESANGDKELLVHPNPSQIMQGMLGLYDWTGLEIPVFLQKKIIDEMKGKESSSVYQYTMDAKGRLMSSDPAAIGYLLLMSINKGDDAKTDYYLTMLETLSRTSALKQELKEQLNDLRLPFLFSRTPSNYILSLRLEALIEENQLTQEISEVKPSSTKSPSTLLAWVLVQRNFTLYLNSISNEASKPLSDFQELFILHGLERRNKECLHYIEDYEKIQKKLSSFKINLEDILEQALVPKQFQERLHLLQSRHGEEIAKSSKLSKLLSPIMGLFFGEGKSAKGQGSLQKTLRTTRLVSTLINNSQSIFGCIDTYNYPTDFTESFKQHSEVLEKLEDVPVDIMTIKQSDLLTHFISYLRLVTNKPDSTWEKTLFAEKREHFLEALKQMKLTAKDPAIKHVLEVLRALTGRTYLSAKGLTGIEKAANPDTLEANALNDQLFLRSYLIRIEKRLETDPSNAHLHAKKVLISSKLELSHEQMQYNVFRESLYGLADALKKCKIASKTSTVVKGGMKAAYAGSKFVTKAAKDRMFTSEQRAHHIPLAVSHSVNVSRNEPLCQNLSAAMEQRESCITTAMDNLFSLFFEEDTNPRPDQVEVPVQTAKADEMDASSVKKFFDRLESSRNAYYQRPSTSASPYHLKSREKTSELLSTLRDCRSQVISLLDSEREKIVKYSQMTAQAEFIGTQETFTVDRLCKALRPVTEKENLFETLYECFLKDDDEKLLAITKLNPAELLILKKKIYLHMITGSRWNLLFAKLETLSKKENPSEQEILELATELKRKRVYGFAGENERLIRTNLAFECGSKFLLWDKPRAFLKAMLESTSSNMVMEMLMGMGKSFCVVPSADFFYANGETFVVNVWPSAVAQENIRSLCERAKSSFAQEVNVPRVSRAIKWTKERIRALKTLFVRAQKSRDQINTTKEELQALELIVIEKALNGDKSFSPMRDILGMLRRSAIALVDEAHVAFSCIQELCFPFGKKMTPPTEWIMPMENILLEAMANEEIREFIGIHKAIFNPHTPEECRAEMQEKLAALMLPYVRPMLFDSNAWEGLELSTPQTAAIYEQQMIKYLAGTAEQIPAIISSHEKKGIIALYKGIISKVLPNSLGKRPCVDYTNSKKHPHEYAIPSTDNENPKEESTIRNIFEAYTKTCLLWLRKRLNQSQIERFINQLKDDALLEMEETTLLGKDKSQAAIFMKKHTDLDLFEIDLENPASLRTIQNSDAIVLAYVRRHIAETMNFYPENLKSDSQDFGSMFAGINALTGTPQEGSHPLDTVLLEDKGNLGENLHISVKQLGDQSSIVTIPNLSPSQILCSPLIESFSTKTRALIDCAGMLEGLNTVQVAQSIMQYLNAHRSDLEGVVYYDDALGGIVILERGSTVAVPLKDSSIPEEKRFTYYDQARTTATDIPQCEGAEALVTVGPSMGFTKFCQGIWRMRGLKTKNQKLKLIAREDFANKLKTEDRLDIYNILEELCRFEGGTLAQENFQSDRKKMYSVIRNAIFNKAVLDAKDDDEFISIIQHFRDIFVSQNCTDLFALFGGIDCTMDAKDFFAKLRNTLMSKLESDEMQIFSKTELLEIRGQMDKIGCGIYPESVNTVKGSDDDDEFSDISDELNGESTSELSTENDQDTDVDQDNFLEQNASVEANDGQSSAAFKEVKWNTSFNIFDLSWLNRYSPFKVAPRQIDEKQAEERLQRKGIFSRLYDATLSKVETMYSPTPSIVPYMDVLRKSEDYRDLNISKGILASENFVTKSRKGIMFSEMQPYLSQQRPILSILVVEHRRGYKKEIKTVILDPDETAYWRHRLSNSREEQIDPEVCIGLFNIETQAVEAQGIVGFRDGYLAKNPRFQKLLTQIKFLNGDTEYRPNQLEILKTWSKRSGIKTLISSFISIHKQMGSQVYRGSKIEKLFTGIQGLRNPQRYSV
jgi:hypothetical protein